MRRYRSDAGRAYRRAELANVRRLASEFFENLEKRSEEFRQACINARVSDTEVRRDIYAMRVTAWGNSYPRPQNTTP